MCYRCFWPKTLCWCPSIQPMPTRTRFVFLMSPQEFKREKAGTGRLTHLCLPHSEIHMGKSFDEHEAVQALLADPRNFPVLLYPGVGARNVSTGGLPVAVDDTKVIEVRSSLGSAPPLGLTINSTEMVWTDGTASGVTTVTVPR